MGLERWTSEGKTEDTTAIFEYLQPVLFRKENEFLLEFQRITFTRSGNYRDADFCSTQEMEFSL